METFTLVLKGPAEGTSLSDLRVRIQEHFSADEETIRELFTELPVVLESDLNLDDAKTQQELFESLGAVVVLESASVKAPLATPTTESSSNELVFELAPEPEAPSNSHSQPEPESIEFQLEPESSLHPITAPPSEEPADNESIDSSIAVSASEVEEMLRDSIEAPLTADEPQNENSLDFSMDSAPSEIHTEQNEQTEPLPKEAVISAFGNNDDSPSEQPLPIEPATHTSNKSSRQLPKPAIFAGIGVCLLAAVGVFIWTSSDTSPPEVLAKEETLAKLLEQQREILADQSAESESITAFPTLTEWAGVSQNETWAEIAFQDETPTQLNFHTTTPRPLDRTPQEIVDRVPPPVWLKRAEATAENQIVIKDDDGTRLLQTRARVYIEHGDEARRVYATLTLTLPQSLEQPGWQSTWSLYTDKTLPIDSLAIRGRKVDIHVNGNVPLLRLKSVSTELQE